MKLPDEIKPGETAGIVEGITDFVQEQVQLLQGEINLELVTEEHTVGAVEEAWQRTFDILDRVPESQGPQAGWFVRQEPAPARNVGLSLIHVVVGVRRGFPGLRDVGPELPGLTETNGVDHGRERGSGARRLAVLDTSE